jgi:hypothetical protein
MPAQIKMADGSGTMGGVISPAKAALAVVKTTSEDAMAVRTKVVVFMVSPPNEKSKTCRAGASVKSRKLRKLVRLAISPPICHPAGRRDASPNENGRRLRDRGIRNKTGQGRRWHNGD